MSSAARVAVHARPPGRLLEALMVRRGDNMPARLLTFPRPALAGSIRHLAHETDLSARLAW
jgi:hypothetical protein